MKSKTIFDEATDAEILTLTDLKDDMSYVLAALLEHVDDGEHKPLCGAKVFERALLVQAGLASDCEECRSRVIVGNMKDHPQRDVVLWEPEPVEGAETMLADKQRRSDGR